MKALVIDGVAIAGQVLVDFRAEAGRLPRPPGLAVIAGEEPAS
jgi:hypothetical protein